MTAMVLAILAHRGLHLREVDEVMSMDDGGYIIKLFTGEEIIVQAKAGHA